MKLCANLSFKVPERIQESIRKSVCASQGEFMEHMIT